MSCFIAALMFNRRTKTMDYSNTPRVYSYINPTNTKRFNMSFSKFTPYKTIIATITEYRPQEMLSITVESDSNRSLLLKEFPSAFKMFRNLSIYDLLIAHASASEDSRWDLADEIKAKMKSVMGSTS